MPIITEMDSRSRNTFSISIAKTGTGDKGFPSHPAISYCVFGRGVCHIFMLLP
jgi:hypothetical protein